MDSNFDYTICCRKRVLGTLRYVLRLFMGVFHVGM